jgi:hypothetical protein
MTGGPHAVRVGVAWGLVVIFFSACGSNQSTNDAARKSMGVGHTVAVINGVVSDAAGRFIANAEVAASSYSVPCPADAGSLGDVTTRTDIKGAFRLALPSPTAPAVRCVAVAVLSPAGRKIVAGAQVRFKPEGDLPYEEVRVDVVVP